MFNYHTALCFPRLREHSKFASVVSQRFIYELNTAFDFHFRA